MNKRNQLIRITITCCLLLSAILGYVDMEITNRFGQTQTYAEMLTLAVGIVGIINIINNEYAQSQHYKQRLSLGMVNYMHDILLSPRYYQGSFLC